MFIMKNLKIKSIPHRKYLEYFFTLDRVGSKQKILKKLLDEIYKKGIKIVYGVYIGKQKNVKSSVKALKDFPIIFIGDSEKKRDLEKNGIFIYALQGKDVKIEYLKENNAVIGTYYRLLNGIEGIYLKTPGNAKYSHPINFRKEADEAYKVIEKHLTKYKFSLKDTYRFWNYMEHIDTNYVSFNQARNYCFQKHGIVDYPAATGIETVLRNGQNINISLEALRRNHKNQITLETFSSDFQCEACKYGPKFSRAKLITFKNDNVQKLYISGTSSVDQEGKSILKDDYEKNVKYVMNCVEHLLGKAHMRYKDIVMSRVYSKNASIEKEFKKLYAKKKWNFPYNKLLSNICRESFIFEIECVAAKKFDKA